MLSNRQITKATKHTGGKHILKKQSLGGLGGDDPRLLGHLSRVPLANIPLEIQQRRLRHRPGSLEPFSDQFSSISCTIFHYSPDPSPKFEIYIILNVWSETCSVWFEWWSVLRAGWVLGAGGPAPPEEVGSYS